MKKSIEEIWKEGFLNNNALVAPKINDFYNQKSNHIIDKMIRMFRWNQYYVILLMVVHLAIGFVAGVPPVGIFLATLFIPLIVFGKKSFKGISQIDKTKNSYDYLKSFDFQLKEKIEDLVKIYKVFYPLYFIGLVSLVLFNDFFGTQLKDYIMNNSNTYMVGGLPIIWISLGVLLLVVVSYFSEPLYRLDLNAVYGRKLKKLEETLNEMEELRKI